MMGLEERVAPVVGQAAPRASVRELADRLGETAAGPRHQLAWGKCQNSVLDRPTRGKPAEKWGVTPQIEPLYGHHSA